MNDSDILSELFKGSPRPFDDLVKADADPIQAAVDALYRQAVRAAEEQGWTVPSRTEIEEQYKREIDGLNSRTTNTA